MLNAANVPSSEAEYAALYRYTVMLLYILHNRRTANMKLVHTFTDLIDHEDILLMSNLLLALVADLSGDVHYSASH